MTTPAPAPWRCSSHRRMTAWEMNFVCWQKSVFWKGFWDELWLIKGSTNAKELSSKGVKIWDAHGSRDFLDSLVLSTREEGDLGPVYSFQWRPLVAEYKDVDLNVFTSRSRLTAKGDWHNQNQPWRQKNHSMCLESKDLPLIPCHPAPVPCPLPLLRGEPWAVLQLYQRSGDRGLGVSFNVASYALLTYMIAHITGLKPGDSVHTLGDAHIYLDHIELLKMQLQGEPRPFPKLKILGKVEKIWLQGWRLSDWRLQSPSHY